MFTASAGIPEDSEDAARTDLPPKSCIPRSAKTTMKRKRRKMREMMDFIEFIRDTTRFLRDAQYLERDSGPFQLSVEFQPHALKSHFQRCKVVRAVTGHAYRGLNNTSPHQ